MSRANLIVSRLIIQLARGNHEIGTASCEANSQNMGKSANHVYSNNKLSISWTKFYFAWCLIYVPGILLTPPGQNFRYIFLNENDRIPIRIWLKFIPRSPIDNKPALIQVMAWRRAGDKPLPESIMTKFIDAYICVTRPQWVKLTAPCSSCHLYSHQCRDVDLLHNYIIFVYIPCQWQIIVRTKTVCLLCAWILYPQYTTSHRGSLLGPNAV